MSSEESEGFRRWESQRSKKGNKVKTLYHYCSTAGHGSHCNVCPSVCIYPVGLGGTPVNPVVPLADRQPTDSVTFCIALTLIADGRILV